MVNKRTIQSCEIIVATITMEDKVIHRYVALVAIIFAVGSTIFAVCVTASDIQSSWSSATNSSNNNNKQASNEPECTIKSPSTSTNSRDTPFEETTPLHHLRQPTNNVEKKSLLQVQSKKQTNTAFGKSSEVMEELESELSQIIGMKKLKEQIRTWAKGIILNEKRRSLGFKISLTKAPHMLFLGNPGTGKTTMARVLGRLLHKFGILSSEKFIEVQRNDLIAEYIGQTGAKTRAKIDEAKGGILFVDEAYRLMPNDEDSLDYGKEALEEIMSIMEGGEVVVIFAGYEEPMKRVLGVNEGFQRRVRMVFRFDDYSEKELAEMLHLKANGNIEDGLLAGFTLHESCTVEAITELLAKKTSRKQRKQLNGGLVNLLLASARENLDRRLSLETFEIEDICTITLEDLEAGIYSIPTGNPAY